jgi:hypothetical protein
MGRFYAFPKIFCPVVCLGSNYLLDGQHKATVPLSTTTHLKDKTMKKLLLLTTVLTTLMVSTPAAHADRYDKSSPKIAHGMWPNTDKSSPKIAHGMWPNTDKSSPKIAHGMVTGYGGKMSPKIAEGMYNNRDNFDDELLYILEKFRSGRRGR